MLNKFTCIITGCALVDEKENKVAWGDLYWKDNVLIFNATLNEDCSTNWMYSSHRHYNWTMAPSNKKLFLRDAATIYEKRGVIVFTAADVEVNYSVRLYLANTPANDIF